VPGAPAVNPALMFEVLVRQALARPSDGPTEYQLQDLLSFMRFLGARAQHLHNRRRGAVPEGSAPSPSRVTHSR
jgi:hypothetical protein